MARRIETLLAEDVASRCTIVPCAEIWSGPFMASQVGDLSEASTMLVRPSYEDLLGAGSIVAALGERLRQSVEASMAVAVFESHRDRLALFLESCVSGRELVERGFGDDVVLAGRLDTRSGVPERGSGDPAKRFTNQPN